VRQGRIRAVASSGRRCPSPAQQIVAALLAGPNLPFFGSVTANITALVFLIAPRTR
jgi:hypothetical protein